MLFFSSRKRHLIDAIDHIQAAYMIALRHLAQHPLPGSRDNALLQELVSIMDMRRHELTMRIAQLEKKRIEQERPMPSPSCQPRNR